jgi:uncharacterized membrane protein YkvA (DUF1232 family)
VVDRRRCRVAPTGAGSHRPCRPAPERPALFERGGGGGCLPRIGVEAGFGRLAYDSAVSSKPHDDDRLPVPTEEDPLPAPVDDEPLPAPVDARTGTAPDGEAPPAPDSDRFPVGEMLALVGRLRAYPVLAYRLASDPRVPAARRAAVLGAAAYMVSPIDAVPGFIPLVGQLDDVAVALLSIHVALRGLDEESQREHLAAVGLDAGVLDRDLETVRAASAWLVRRGIRVGAATARVGGRVAVASARVGARVGTSIGARGVGVARAMIDRAGPVGARVGEAGARRGATAARSGATAARSGATAARHGAANARTSVSGAAERGRGIAGSLRARARRSPAEPGDRASEPDAGMADGDGPDAGAPAGPGSPDGT